MARRGNDARGIVSIDFRCMDDRRGRLAEGWPGMHARIRRFTVTASPPFARNIVALRGNDASRIISIDFRGMSDRRECPRVFAASP
jgi:hypothetical protein